MGITIKKAFKIWSNKMDKKVGLEDHHMRNIIVNYKLLIRFSSNSSNKV